MPNGEVSAAPKPNWGLLPQQVEARIRNAEWLNTANLKSRLLGLRPFPIKINLKVPSAQGAIADMPRFTHFIERWQAYPHTVLVEWQLKSYRTLGEQRIPHRLTLHSIEDLITVIGTEAEQRSAIWQVNMAPLLELSTANIYPVLVKHLQTIEQLSLNDCHLLKHLVEQLLANMGLGQYLRALPLAGVDTKFLENHQSLVADVLDAIHGNAVTVAGGLLAWLGCSENPQGWLCVRALCTKTQAAMGGLPILQLPLDVLIEYALPATNILVIENRQSGLGLPYFDDTIAVFGGGKNTAWMNAPWLKNKRVAYWGDIDTWGLAILSDVRSKLPTVTPLMMNIETIKQFEGRMVVEPEHVELCPALLTKAEQTVFKGLKNGAYYASRLEQERLSADYILLNISRWLST